jgi:hypothetical protein
MTAFRTNFAEFRVWNQSGSYPFEFRTEGYQLFFGIWNVKFEI